MKENLRDFGFYDQVDDGSVHQAGKLRKNMSLTEVILNLRC